jgi:uncharacterized protein (DUF1015 family)
MATLPDLVAPFRGERYRAADRLSRLIAPPYDVIATDQRDALAARDEHNIVHAMLPEATATGDKYQHAARLLAAWREGGVLLRDPEPTLYVMAQTFALPSGERRTRTGLFAAVAAEGYGSRRIRPHERTHRAPKADRLALLRATRTNVESIFLIVPDADGALATAVAAASAGPPDVTAELDGVAVALWAVSGDPSPFPLPPAPLYLADGHHRYETASAFAREKPTADRLLAFIVSARDPGLVVLPTHRVIFGAARAPGRLMGQWRERFQIDALEPGGDPSARLAAVPEDRTACVVLGPDGQEVLLTLKPGADLSALERTEPNPTVRALDITRIEQFIVREIIAAGETTVTLDYNADAARATAIVRAGRAAAVAVLVRPTRVAQVFAVADAEGVMPPKSTFFVPKVPSGVVLRPLD